MVLSMGCILSVVTFHFMGMNIFVSLNMSLLVFNILFFKKCVLVFTAVFYSHEPHS
jgi:hypothetical protein